MEIHADASMKQIEIFCDQFLLVTNIDQRY